MTDEQDLTELTVDEQENQLEDLDLEELKDLRGREERNTAMNNIDREISNRQKDSRDEDWSETVSDTDEEITKEDVEEAAKNSKSVTERRNELERKVDYLIEECKTTSHEGFKDYEN